MRTRFKIINQTYGARPLVSSRAREGGRVPCRIVSVADAVASPKPFHGFGAAASENMRPASASIDMALARRQVSSPLQQYQLGAHEIFPVARKSHLPDAITK